MKKLMLALLVFSLFGCSEQSTGSNEPVGKDEVAVVTTTTKPVVQEVVTTKPVAQQPVVTTTTTTVKLIETEVTTTKVEETPVVTTTTTSKPVVTTKPVTTTTKPVTTTTVTTTTKPVVTTVTTTTTTRKPLVDNPYSSLKDYDPDYTITVNGKDYYEGETVVLNGSGTYYISSHTDSLQCVTSNEYSVVKELGASSQGFKLQAGESGTATIAVVDPKTGIPYTFYFKVSGGSSSNYPERVGMTEAEYKEIGHAIMDEINQWFVDNNIDFQYEWNETYYQAALDAAKVMDDANRFLEHNYRTDEYVSKWGVALKDTADQVGCYPGVGDAATLTREFTFMDSPAHWSYISQGAWDGSYITSGDNGFGIAFLYDKDVDNTYVIMRNGYHFE